MASEAQAISDAHKKWIVQFVKANGGEVTVGSVYDEGEKHDCDTLGSLLVKLKKEKVIDFKPVFLFNTTHKDEIITLVDEDAYA